MTSNWIPKGVDPNTAYTGLSYCSSEQHLQTLLEHIYKACDDQEWAWYVQFVTHILCATPSAAIANSHLKTFLRGHTNLQLYHEGLRSELFDPDEPNLPSVLTVDKTDAVFIHFKKWTLGRVQYMIGNILNRKIARNAMLRLLWESFDVFDEIKQERREQAARLELVGGMQAALRAQEREEIFRKPTLHIFGPTPLSPGRGIVGIIDLTALLGKLSVTGPMGLWKHDGSISSSDSSDVASDDSWVHDDSSSS